MTHRTILLASLLLAVAAGAGAQDAGSCDVPRDQVRSWIMAIGGEDYEVHPSTPTYEGTTGLFHLPSAHVMPRGRVSASLFRDNLDRDPKDEDISIHGLSLAYGLSDRLELFGNFGLQNRIDADALGQDGFVNDYPFVNTPWETGVGDIKIGLKLGLSDDYRGAPVSFALRAFVKLPTADEARGLGTGKASFGGDLLLSKSLGGKADVHAGLGYQVNGDPDGVDLGNAFRWGVGLNLPACRKAQLQAEVTGAVYSGESFEQTNPIDLVVGPVFWIKPGIFLRAALSWNLGFDDRGLGSGSSSWTGRHFSIGFHPGTACCKIAPPPPPPPPPPANRVPTVTCASDRATVLPGEKVGLRASGADPDGDVLDYTWTTSAGRIAGSGPVVELDTAGVAAPATFTAIVRCSDGRGGTASATCNVALPAPVAKPAVVVCESAGFPRGLARLNNVDKACLDDLVARLRQDPRTRVIVIGHADRSEPRPNVVARLRAEAAKSYVVKERGIEESRVAVREVGASRPHDTGSSAQARASNRRVEVIYVPEGATPPED
jgi:outer membrane protein OmpA-like peptidoglycan-associated protein